VRMYSVYLHSIKRSVEVLSHVFVRECEGSVNFDPLTVIVFRAKQPTVLISSKRPHNEAVLNCAGRTSDLKTCDYILSLTLNTVHCIIQAQRFAFNSSDTPHK
jgi:hypothetical protein